MPSNYTSIQHPDPFGPNGLEGYRYRNQLLTEKMEVELKQLRLHHMEVVKHLESIFNRIADGKAVKLNYPDGKVITVGAVEKGDMT
jgi:hypothetical protein